ncbi:MAG: Mini-ribonuclease 3 [Eubacteriales bacterium]|jgi:ribonuclease-3 family protein
MRAAESADASALAYLGDAVVELWVRERLLQAGVCGPHELHEQAKRYVAAPAQAAAMKRILPLLSDEENMVFHRGRNAGHTSLPKNATAAEYRAASGMEALFGWLYLSGRGERISELLEAGYKSI